jgi:hypothetical protein
MIYKQKHRKPLLLALSSFRAFVPSTIALPWKTSFPVIATALVTTAMRYKPTEGKNTFVALTRKTIFALQNVKCQMSNVKWFFSDSEVFSSGSVIVSQKLFCFGNGRESLFSGAQAQSENNGRSLMTLTEGFSRFLSKKEQAEVK